MELISIGDNIGKGSYYIHSVFPKIINFKDEQNRIISLIEKREWEGPDTLLVSRMNLPTITEIKIDENKIWLGNHFFFLNEVKIYCSNFKPDINRINTGIIRKNLVFCERLLDKYGHPKSLAFIFNSTRECFFISAFEKLLVLKVYNALKFFKKQDIITGLTGMKGLGWGLTPCGDDFNAGILLGIHFNYTVTNTKIDGNRGEWYRAISSTNPLTDSFLRLAVNGKCGRKLNAFFSALLEDDPEKLEKSFQQVVASGETSGSDLLSGFLFYQLKILKLDN